MADPGPSASSPTGRIRSSGPDSTPSEGLLSCRYATLRAPLGLPPGSERLADDQESLHAWVELTDTSGLAALTIVSVGRAHLIPAGADGSQADYEGPKAARCPGFEPLISPDSDFPRPSDLRPAFHIRQMGTLPEHRRKGHARSVLRELEARAVDTWSAKSGWLQARIPAIPFYESCGWEAYGDVYEVKGIGPHRSMWRSFTVDYS